VRVILFLVLISILFIPTLAFSQATPTSESVTLTTYYPAPYGEYRQIKLSPQASLGSACDNAGAMYYNSADNKPYYCNGTIWQPIGVGGITVQTGWLWNGGQIPIPAGYTASQCNWIVSQRKDPGINDAIIHECITYADINRYVRMYELDSGWNGEGSWINGDRGAVNYLIICGSGLNIIKN